MPTSTTQDRFPQGIGPVVYRGFVDRSNTTAKELFVLPAYSIVVGVAVNGKAASDASSSADISIGLMSNLCNEILSAYDVKTSGTGLGLTVPNATAGSTGSNTFTVGSNAMRIGAKYAETGSASSAGGPWEIYLTVLTV